MKRKITLRSTLLALGTAPLLMAALPALAQDAPGTIISIIGGLAPDDLLNIRATASPGAKVQARLPNGAAVKNFGCNVVNGYPWCKVEDTQDAHITGWAPARYLSPGNPTPAPEDAATPAPEAAVAPPPAPEAVAPPPPAAEPAPAPPAAREAPPPDIEARLGGAGPAEAPSATDIGRTAMQDAVGLALAASATAADGSPDPSASDADGGIPCARRVGQPMTHCEISVARTGDDSAVTVTWPDGGTRVISFHGNQPAGSDSQDEFRFTREGTLNMIRIGAAERFEITDALALGE